MTPLSKHEWIQQVQQASSPAELRALLLRLPAKNREQGYRLLASHAPVWDEDFAQEVWNELAILEMPRLFQNPACPSPILARLAYEESLSLRGLPSRARPGSGDFTRPYNALYYLFPSGHVPVSSPAVVELQEWLMAAESPLRRVGLRRGVYALCYHPDLQGEWLEALYRRHGGRMQPEVLTSIAGHGNLSSSLRHEIVLEKVAGWANRRKDAEASALQGLREAAVVRQDPRCRAYLKEAALRHRDLFLMQALIRDGWEDAGMLLRAHAEIAPYPLAALIREHGAEFIHALAESDLLFLFQSSDVAVRTAAITCIPPLRSPESPSRTGLQR